MNIPARANCAGGFTLIELLVSFGLGVVVIGGVLALSIFSSANFVGTANYVRLNDQSRNAVDQISREIRNATALVSFSTNNPQFLLLTNATLGKSTTVTYNAASNTVTIAKSGQATQTLLTGCDNFSFQLYDRYPLITSTNISFYSSTNYATGQVDPKFCKVINMNWTCSRTILGSKLNTEFVQTAQVVMRNQVKN
jgi:type II secretory pathway pseudopilin PulG